MQFESQINTFSSFWILSYLSFVLCGNEVFKLSQDVNEFNRFAYEEVLKAVYPLDISDLKYVIDGTVDKEILSSDKFGTYGCFKPHGSPTYQYMVRVYSECELAVLEANPSAERYGCSKKGGNNCELTISSKLAFSERATGGWKVGAVVSTSASAFDLAISTEYGESWETSKMSEDSIERKVTLSPGQTAIPYVIVGGIRCHAAYHGVQKDLIGKLSSKGSEYEGETIACQKGNACLFSCDEFKNDDSINNDFTRYKVPRNCIYNKPTAMLYPVTRDPVVPCRLDRPPFFKGNITMPLYGKNNKLIKIFIVYITDEKDIKH